jgi:hypothetical protein
MGITILVYGCMGVWAWAGPALSFLRPDGNLTFLTAVEERHQPQHQAGWCSRVRRVQRKWSAFCLLHLLNMDVISAPPLLPACAAPAGYGADDGLVMRHRLLACAPG